MAGSRAGVTVAGVTVARPGMVVAVAVVGVQAGVGVRGGVAVGVLKGRS